jgi:hypothetical protein
MDVASLPGTSAISLPLLADDGRPLGLRMISGTDRDAALLAVARALLGTVLNRPELLGRTAPASCRRHAQRAVDSRMHAARTPVFCRVRARACLEASFDNRWSGPTRTDRSRFTHP